MTANETAAVTAPHADVKERIRRALPPFPGVALQLMSLLDSEVAVRQIIGLLRVDPAVSGEILRVSNSALYGMSRRVETVGHAVVILGGDTVKRLALTVAMGRFSQRFIRHEGLKHCWRHSVACAMTAETVAELLYLPKDVAYTVGLLHDVGKLGLLAAHPDHDGAEENRGPALEREREAFGLDHCQVGGWLAQQWNLPQAVREGIERHHAALEGDGIIGLAAAVNAADRIAGAIGYASSSAPSAFDVDEILKALPLSDPEAASERIARLPDDIERCIAAVSPRG